MKERLKEIMWLLIYMAISFGVVKLFGLLPENIQEICGKILIGTAIALAVGMMALVIYLSIGWTRTYFKRRKEGQKCQK